VTVLILCTSLAVWPHAALGLYCIRGYRRVNWVLGATLCQCASQNTVGQSLKHVIVDCPPAVNAALHQLVDMFCHFLQIARRPSQAIGLMDLR
jgi:hypothetical protein